MKTAKELELLLLVKEHEKQKLQFKIEQAIEYIEQKEKWYKNEEYKLLKTSDLLNILEGEKNGKN